LHKLNLIRLEKDIFSYIYLSMVLIGIMVSAIFTYYNYRRSCFGKLISIQLLLSSYGIGVATLAANDLMIYFPHVFRTGMLILYIIPALIYLALIKGIAKEPFKPGDIIHIVPAILYIINFLPSLTATSEEKKQLISELKYSYYQEGIIFKSYGINLLIIILLLGYIIKIYLKFFHFNQDTIHPSYKKTATIFISYLSIQLMIPVLTSLGFFDCVHRETVAFYAITTIALYTALLFRPKFVYGIETHAEYVATRVDPTELYPSGGNQTKLQEQPTDLIRKPEIDDSGKTFSEEFIKMENYLNKSKDFLKVDFSQKWMMDATGLSSYQIRQILKKEKKCNFSEYINNKRIVYLLEHLRDNPLWRIYDSNTLANESGYQSVNTFYNAFKKVTGTTPKNYVEQMFKIKV
jgi:AraC-like DNA-binding protein